MSIDLPNPAFTARFMPKAAPESEPKSRWRLSDADRKRIVALRNKGFALEAIAERVGCHLNTAHKIVSEAVAKGLCTPGRMTRK
jgi:hypothetical protein